MLPDDSNRWRRNIDKIQSVHKAYITGYTCIPLNTYVHHEASNMNTFITSLNSILDTVFNVLLNMYSPLLGKNSMSNILHIRHMYNTLTTI
jgi:hypothetical protein